MFQIVQIGGVTNYSWELKWKLAQMPYEQRRRILDEIEYKNRPRRVIRYKQNWTAIKVLQDEIH